MATKVVYTLREDKQGLQKQLGCMNGIFQLFDRRYLLGLHRSRNHKRLIPGTKSNLCTKQVCAYCVCICVCVCVGVHLKPVN